MKRIIEAVITLTGLAIMVSSCSIKEDRTPCPCWLDIFLPETYKCTVGISLWQGNTQLLSEDIGYTRFVPFLEKEVKRGFNRLSAFKNNGDLNLSATSVKIEPGQQCDSLYAYCDVVDCRGEFAMDTIVFHKQFATLSLQIVNPQEITYPYALTVKGNVSGIELTSLKPIEGAFKYTTALDEDYIGTCRLPRQKDSSLSLDMNKVDDGTLVDTIPLGELISRTGYNWSAEDLDDITITIDFAKAEIVVTVNEWQSEYTYEIEI